jgi:hypothetical protein
MMMRAAGCYDQADETQQRDQLWLCGRVSRIALMDAFSHQVRGPGGGLVGGCWRG